jgi:hypothetical protein
MSLNISDWISDNEQPREATISEVEKKLGVKLPSAYIALMKSWNGGYLPNEHQVLIGEKIPEKLNYYLGEGFWGLGTLSGISTDLNNSDGIIYTSNTAHEWGIPEKVIAFDGDGHTWLAFDYRDEALNEPKIIFIESDDLNYFTLANNFSDFLEKLIPSDQVYDYDGNVIYNR